MHIDSETARLRYLPDSSLFAWLAEFYEDELEFRVNGNPHEVTAADLAAELESEQVEPLQHDWNGLNDDQLTPLWSELAYPLPHDAEELAHSCYGITPSDIARAALAEYANLYDVEAAAAAVLQRLRDEYDSDNSSSGSSCSSN